MNPTCPTHGTPLKPPKGKGFSWYCPQKMPDGSWCPTKVKASNPAPIPQHAPPAQPGATLAGSGHSDEAIRLRLCEALMKAGVMPDDALFHAKAMFEWVKEGK